VGDDLVDVVGALLRVCRSLAKHAVEEASEHLREESEDQVGVGREERSSESGKRSIALTTDSLTLP